MSNDKYELLCQPTDDSKQLSKEKVLVPFKTNKIPDTKTSLLTKKIINIILISLSTIILIILIGIYAKRIFYSYKNSQSVIKINVRRRS